MNADIAVTYQYKDSTADSHSPATLCEHIHSGVFIAMLLIYAWLFSVFLLVFRNSSEALFMVIISLLYTVIYFLVPCLMVRQSGHQLAIREHTLGDWLAGRVKIATGIISTKQAAFQILLIPVALAAAATGIAAAIEAARTSAGL